MSYRVKRLNLMSHEDLLVLYFYLWIPILVICHSNCHLYDLEEHCNGLPQCPATRSHREFIKTIKLNWCVLKLSTQTPKTHQISIILQMDEKFPCYVLILWLLFFSACFILWDKGFFFVNVLLPDIWFICSSEICMISTSPCILPTEPVRHIISQR